MINVLFVCLGNICRSPLAEGVFMKLTEDQGVAHLFKVDSAGTASYHIGNLPDHRSIEVAAVNGIKLTSRARALTQSDFVNFDYMVVMDKNNWYDVQKRKPENAQCKIVLMRDFDSQEQGGEVPDPYYGNQKDFEIVYEILWRSCSRFLTQLMQK